MLKPSREAEFRIEDALQTTFSSKENTLLFPETPEDEKHRLDLMLTMAELATAAAFLSPEEKKLLERLDNEGYLFQMREHLEQRCIEDKDMGWMLIDCG